MRRAAWCVSMVAVSPCLGAGDARAQTPDGWRDLICYAVVTLQGTGATDPPEARTAAAKLLPVARKIVASFAPAQ